MLSLPRRSQEMCLECRCPLLILSGGIRGDDTQAIKPSPRELASAAIWRKDALLAPMILTSTVLFVSILRALSRQIAKPVVDWLESSHWWTQVHREKLCAIVRGFKSPALSPTAPVNAPFVWPKSSASKRVSVRPPQFTAMKGPFRDG